MLPETWRKSKNYTRISLSEILKWEVVGWITSFSYHLSSERTQPQLSSFPLKAGVVPSLSFTSFPVYPAGKSKFPLVHPWGVDLRKSQAKGEFVLLIMNWKKKSCEDSSVLKKMKETIRMLSTKWTLQILTIKDLAAGSMSFRNFATLKFPKQSLGLHFLLCTTVTI